MVEILSNPICRGLKLSIPLRTESMLLPSSIKLLWFFCLDTLPLDMHMTFQVSAEYQLLKSLASPSSTAIFTCLPNLAKCFLFPLLIEQLSGKNHWNCWKMIYRQPSLPLASSIPGFSNPGSETHRYLGLTVPKHFVKGIHGFGDQSHLWIHIF